MLGFLRRRRRPRSITEFATRPVVEMLESRRLMDGVIYDSSDPVDPQLYYGTNNTDTTASMNNWTHQWGFTSENIPAHTHLCLSVGFAMDVNIDPNTGTSISDDTQDEGYICIDLNGSTVWSENVATGQQQYAWNAQPNGYGPVMVTDNSDTADWSVYTTSDNVYINVGGANEQAGTYAGFANMQPAQRGGTDGSVDVSLDAKSAGQSVCFTMPCDVVINNGGTPDDQLPNSSNGQQPYATINDSNLELSASNPGDGYDTYSLYFPPGTQQQTIHYHMVTPYWCSDEGDDHDTYNIACVQDAPTTIPVLGGWFNAAAGIVWQGMVGQRAITYTVSPHTFDPNNNELPPGTIAILANALQDSTTLAGPGWGLVGNLISGLSAAASQYDHDVLMSVLAGVGGKIPNAFTTTLTLNLTSAYLTGTTTEGCTVSFSASGLLAIANGKFPTGVGSLWTAATSGFLSRTDTERTALSYVDETVFAPTGATEVDFYWTGPGIINLVDPLVSPPPGGFTGTEQFTVKVEAELPLTGKPMSPAPPTGPVVSTLIGYSYTSTYTAAQWASAPIAVKIVASGETLIASLRITITETNLNAAGVRTTVGTWGYNAEFSSAPPLP